MKFLLAVLLIVGCANAIELERSIGEKVRRLRCPWCQPSAKSDDEYISQKAMMKYARAHNYTHQPIFLRSLDTISRYGPLRSQDRYVKSRMVIGITSCPMDQKIKICIPSPRNVQKVQILKFVYLRQYGPHHYVSAVDHAIVPLPKRNQRALIPL